MKKLLQAMSFGFALSAAVPAQATDFYLAAGVGKAKVKIDSSDIPAGWAVSKDESGNIQGVLVGLGVHKNLSFEANYYNFDGFGLTATSGANRITASIKGDGYGLSAVGRWFVLDNLTLFAKVGAARSNIKAEVKLNGATVSRASDRSTDPVFGLGSEFFFTKNWFARLEANRIVNVGGNNVGKSNVDSFSVGLGYKF